MDAMNGHLTVDAEQRGIVLEAVLPGSTEFLMFILRFFIITRDLYG